MINSLKVLLKAPYNKDRFCFALYRWILWKIIKFFRLKDVKIKIWDNRFIFLDYNSFQCMWIMYNYVVDWEEFQLISKVVKSDDHVFDIGANMGFYTVWMSKFIFTGKIHSFEPALATYNRLIKNISVNNIQHIVDANLLGISNRDGKAYFTRGLDGENHIIKNENKHSELINTQKLDTYAYNKNIPLLRYVKIDVEGFEYNVLKGADSLLRNKIIHFIQLEINITIRNSGADIEDLLDLLEQYDYALCKYDIGLNRLVPIEYSKERENYFAVYDIKEANKQLC